MSGILLGGILGCRRTDRGAQQQRRKKNSQINSTNTTETHRNSSGDREQKGPPHIRSRMTNDMEILVCGWFKGTISLALSVLHKATPVQIN